MPKIIIMEAGETREFECEQFIALGADKAGNIMGNANGTIAFKSSVIQLLQKAVFEDVEKQRKESFNMWK